MLQGIQPTNENIRSLTTEDIFDEVHSSTSLSALMRFIFWPDPAFYWSFRHFVVIVEIIDDDTESEFGYQSYQVWVRLKQCGRTMSIAMDLSHNKNSGLRIHMKADGFKQCVWRCKNCYNKPFQHT